MFYLDNAATTRPLDCVCDKMDHTFRNMFGNPSALYSLGVDAEKEINEVRSLVASVLKVKDKNIYFTSSATESNNIAIRGYLDANSKAGNHIICSSIEHPSVMEVFKAMGETGWDVDHIPVNNEGVIDLEAFERLLREDTVLVSVMAVNNETGAIQPFDEIKKIIRKKRSKAALHVDCVQAFTKIAVSPVKMGIDMLTVSGHKIFGPKGVSCVYISDGIRFRPVTYGGGQEKGIRPGTENVPAIAGFGTAVKYMFDNFEYTGQRYSILKEIFVNDIKQKVNKTDPVFISNDRCVPNIISVSFPGIRSEVLLHHLEQRDVYVSSGSACSNNKSGKSYVLKEMNYDKTISDAVLRISPSFLMTDDEMKSAVTIIADVVNMLA